MLKTSLFCALMIAAPMVHAADATCPAGSQLKYSCTSMASPMTVAGSPSAIAVCESGGQSALSLAFDDGKTSVQLTVVDASQAGQNGVLVALAPAPKQSTQYALYVIDENGSKMGTVFDKSIDGGAMNGMVGLLQCK